MSRKKNIATVRAPTLPPRRTLLPFSLGGERRRGKVYEALHTNGRTLPRITSGKVTFPVEATRPAKIVDANHISAFRTLYDVIVGAGEALHPEVELPVWQGGRAKQSVACNLLRRFRKHADAILLFIRDLAVQFTNNVAERAVRMPKVKQKTFGCFRTIEGADNFCVIRSCLDTLREQGRGMLEVLQRAFAGNPIQRSA